MATTNIKNQQPPSMSCCGEDNGAKKPSTSPPGSATKNTMLWKGVALIAIALLLFSQFFIVTVTPKYKISNRLFSQSLRQNSDTASAATVDISSLQQVVLPAEGVQLPIRWGDFGQKMIRDGVIDEQKFRALFENGLPGTDEQMLTGTHDGSVIMTAENNRYLLDILWAFGLANKNAILTEGEMMDSQYGGAGNFASTGGWSLSKGNAMDHYSMHAYVALTKEQQELVDRVSRGIFRPCCGNSTHFPDCNHGMAMLGLLELMAANGVNEQDMYTVALKVNSFWFPQTYLDLATYFKEQGTEWKDVDPKTVLGSEYSSAQGYQQTRLNIQSLPKPQSGGNGCGA